jgi:hypothetical protein
MEAAAYKQTAPDHIITLNYGDDRLAPDPEVLLVRVGDKIAFRPGTIPADHVLKITFDHPEYFSAATYKEGDDPITVLHEVSRGAGTYRCGVAQYGEIVDPSTLKPGGAIEVDTASSGGR